MTGTQHYDARINSQEMAESDPKINMMPTKNTSPKKKMMVRAFVCFGLALSFWTMSPGFTARAQQPAVQKKDQASVGQTSAGQTSKDQPAKEKTGTDQPVAGQETKPAAEAAPAEHPAEHQPTSIGGELAKETRVAEGEEEEEHSDLKHSGMVQRLAKVTGMSVHGAHIFALIFNFVVIVALLMWAIRKTVPGIMRARNESIQRALEEARKASQEAGQRLTDIENRLRQMDVEIGRMQASAEKEAEAEETRIKKAAEDDLRKVVQSAEQEIVAAAKQIRRELAVHTADLALGLARKQINVDPNTDQVLVRNFAAKIAASPATRDNGKDGR